MYSEQQAFCLNCKSTLSGNYCHNCGQSAAVGRISFKETIEGFLSSTFSLEGNLMKTIRILILNPGRMFSEFINGKRQNYYKPVAFFVVSTALYLIIRGLINYDPLHGQAVLNDTMPEIRKRSIEAAHFMVKNINNIMFILVFSMALSMKTFYPKRFRLAEYTTIGFYIAGIYILFGTLFMLFLMITDLSHNQIQLFFLIIYIIYCCKSFFQKSDFLSWLKYTLISLLSLVLYLIFGFGTSLLIVSI